MSARWSKTFWADLAERVGSTFLGTLIPAAIAAGNLAALDWVNALELAGSAAGISLLKGLAANMADPASGPSLLPAPPAPEVNESGAVDALLLIAVAALVLAALAICGVRLG